MSKTHLPKPPSRSLLFFVLFLHYFSPSSFRFCFFLFNFSFRYFPLLIFLFFLLLFFYSFTPYSSLFSFPFFHSLSSFFFFLFPTYFLFPLSFFFSLSIIIVTFSFAHFSSSGFVTQSSRSQQSEWNFLLTSRIQRKCNIDLACRLLVEKV